MSSVEASLRPNPVDLSPFKIPLDFFSSDRVVARIGSEIPMSHSDRGRLNIFIKHCTQMSALRGMFFMGWGAATGGDIRRAVEAIAVMAESDPDVNNQLSHLDRGVRNIIDNGSKTPLDFRSIMIASDSREAVYSLAQELYREGQERNGDPLTGRRGDVPDVVVWAPIS